jgi:uncharacterized membrane protein
MDPTALIAFWAVAFVASHLVISSAAVRPRMVAGLGEMPYRGVYSLVAFATFIPLTFAFARHKHAGPLLWYLRDIAPLRWLTWLLMLAALILLVASLINPNPGALGAPGIAGAPRGVLKVTRHPNFVAFILFGFAHLLMNGWAGDVVFFGTFPAIGILGGLHQDRRKLREIGEPYRQFKAQTSFIPFAAILSGRQRWQRSDLPWLAIGVGAALTVVIFVVHPIIFGGNPLG